jgi:hypothetical protein
MYAVIIGASLLRSQASQTTRVEMNMPRAALCLLGIAFCMLLGPKVALACGCMPSMLKTERERILEERKTSKAIFSGKVLTIEVSRNAYWAVKLKVERAWKNINSDEVVIFTMIPDGASCGVEFVVGESYLVYTYNAFENELWTSHCNRTQKLMYAQADLRFLGTGKMTKARKHKTQDGTKIL